VGKSTIINAILGEPRMIVDNVPGTTRDAVDIEVSINGEQWVFIDTGGVKKKERFFPDFPRPLIWIKRNSKRKLFHISSSLSQSECYNSRIK